MVQCVRQVSNERCSICNFLRYLLRYKYGVETSAPPISEADFSEAASIMGVLEQRRFNYNVTSHSLGGALLQEIVSYFVSAASGKEFSPKVVLYFAHYPTLYS